MTGSSTVKLFSAALLLTLMAGCGVPYTMETPTAFRKYEETKEFKMITADGVKLKAREVENYPKASLDFWTDASKKHLVKSGYTHQETTCFKTAQKLDGCTIRFMLPHGAEDWVYQETLFVVDDTIVIVEAAGEWEKFKTVQDDLQEKLKTFRPNL